MKTITEFMSSKMTDYTIHATDANIHDLVKQGLKKYGHNADLNYIDVSEVTYMSNLFSCHRKDLGEEYKDLNPDISQWDVSNVEIMQDMFYCCVKFNCDISKWKTGKVRDMTRMFYFCENFNCDISKWDVSNVTDMHQMLYGCFKFNQDLSKWDVSMVGRMDRMFNFTEMEDNPPMWWK